MDRSTPFLADRPQQHSGLPGRSAGLVLAFAGLGHDDGAASGDGIAGGAQ
jgi:hypothetical protein